MSAAAHDDDDTYYLSFKLPTRYTPREQMAPGLPEGTELMALLHMLEKKRDAGKVRKCRDTRVSYRLRYWTERA